MGDMINMKIVIIGDGACGKSALLLTYIKKEFPSGYVPTVVENYDVIMSFGANTKLKLTVIDTAGQEEFQGIRSLSYANTHVAMICYSCDNRGSLDNVKSLWVPEIRVGEGRADFVLVGNKVDLAQANPSRAVSSEEGMKMCSALGGYAAMQCTAKYFQKRPEQCAPGEFTVQQVFKKAIECGASRLGLLDKQDGICAACTVL